MLLHKITMMVRIPEEEWEAFKESIKETGYVQFKFRDSTVFAEVF